MQIDLFFVTASMMLGVGLAMDAFSVSIANGLNDPGMSRGRMCLIAGTYAVFQYAMPMIGWFCVHTIAEAFQAFQKFIPWIALILLLWIGGKMLIEGIRKIASKKEIKEEAALRKEAEEGRLGYGELFVQGVATSIDALSVGFTIAQYDTLMANVCSLIVAGVTFVICMTGLIFGRKFGTKLSDKASILGGLILIGIGISIFVRG